MNTWGYLILIAVLLVLAVAMLYARFANRSREKSLHHSPVELTFPSETISVARHQETEIKLEPVTAHENNLHFTEKAGETNGAYLDDLQEAAAGLAVLMRSSPISRTEPVVFAPEEEIYSPEIPTEEFSDCPVDEVNALAGEILIEEENVISEENVVAEENVIAEENLIEEENVVAEENLAENIAVYEEPEEPILTRRELLGDSVSDTIDRLDKNLDALESLVLNIESSLRSLNGLVTEEDDESSLSLAEADVAEAA